MSPTIIWPSDEYRVGIIDAIRDAIGRLVTFYVVASSYDCPISGCGYDPIAEGAIDPFCLTCSGTGKITTYSGIPISGHVNWWSSDKLEWVSGGQLDEGECRVQIKYTVANLEAVDTAKWVDVDGKNLQIMKRELRGVPLTNRIIILLEEKEKD